MKQLKSKWISKNSETRLYHIPVPIVGLTGGIATGKSTVAKLFIEKNIPVIDADQLVKNVYRKNEAIEFLKQHFSEVLINQPLIDFKKLRAIVFENAEAKKKLEDFIYKYLPGEFEKVFSSFKNPPFIVYDVPLLFEKKLDTMVDVSVCVYASREIQLTRLMSRDQIPHELAQKILFNQMPIEDKKQSSQLVIENNLSLNELVKSFEKTLEDLVEDRA